MPPRAPRASRRSASTPRDRSWRCSPARGGRRLPGRGARCSRRRGSWSPRDPGLQLAAPNAPTLDPAPLRAAAAGGSALAVTFLEGQAHELLAASDAAVVASGTATLEASLALCPLVVVYKTSWLTY